MRAPVSQVMLARAESSYRYAAHLLRQAEVAADGVRAGTRPAGHPRALGSMACEQLEVAARSLRMLAARRML